MRHYLSGFLALLLLSGCSWFVTPPSRVDNPVIEGVNYVGMAVSDLERSEKLYRDATEVQLIEAGKLNDNALINDCLLYTSPSPRDGLLSRMPSSA